jgi:hypothetical protein
VIVKRQLEGGLVTDRTTDEPNYEQLFLDGSDGLFRTIYAFTGRRRAIAEDAVAEAFTRAIALDARQRDPMAWNAVPPRSRALTVASGARIAFLEPGYYPGGPGSTQATLSYADPTPPYDEIGTIDFQDPGQVVTAPPGQYLFRWHVEVHHITIASKDYDGFHGDLVCPMDVVEPVRD